MAKEIKVIFLDCDGVISPFSNESCFQPEKMKLLKKIVTEASKGKVPVEIVLSSSWRTTEFGRREVAKHLAIHSMRPFISVTPDLCSSGKNTPRSIEILRWIDDNKNTYRILNFIALDDINLPALAPNREFFSQHSVVTNGATGLTDADVEKAIKLLSDDNNIKNV